MSNHPQPDNPRPDPDPAAVPAPGPDYPPTAQFPADPVNYAPPGHTPDYGEVPYQPFPDYPGSTAQPAPGYQPPPGYEPTAGYPPGGYQQEGGYQPPTAFQPPTGYPPPAGYQPPGYQPPPGYPGQPGYPAADPQQPGPPPRKSSVPLVAVIVAITLLLCGGVATAGVMAARNVADQAREAVKPITELPTVAPTLPSLPTEVPGATGRKITVTYEVTGDGPAAIMYVKALGAAPTKVDNVKLPWKFSAEVETPALLSVIAMRADSTEGTISCRALVDGGEVAQRTSGGGTFATATCTHFALD